MNTIKEGQMVESKLVANKFGTVVATAGDMVEVRWDGETTSVYTPRTRLKLRQVRPPAADYMADLKEGEFKRGDYLEVETNKFGVVRGTALTDFTLFGYASYELLAEDGNYYALNSNYDKFTVLFRADIARGHNPDY